MDDLDPFASGPPQASPERLAKDALATDETVQRNLSASDRPASTHSAALPDGAQSGLEGAKTVIRVGEEDVSSTPATAGRTPAEVAQVLVGQQLNQYFLEELVGGGGMGAVFRAHDQQLDRIVALKVIPFVSGDAEVQRRFRNEAQNAAKLDHPRIARVFDAGSHSEWHYIVFEYIQGTNLRDLVEQGGALTLDDAVFVTQQVAEALDHASQRRIVHRDIKPSNVLIGDDGDVKLVDMGLARSDNLELSEDMTASGVTLGTFDYISPEQALDPRDADTRSDIYSLGCTFYYMVTGEAPYTGGTMLQKLLSHGNAPLPDPRALRSELPDEFVAVMHRMMAKDPKMRYQNASDLLGDLSELAYRFGLKRARARSVYVAPANNPGLERISIHLPWVIAVALMLLVGGYLELQSVAMRDPFSKMVSPPRREPSPSDVVTTSGNVVPTSKQQTGPEGATAEQVGMGATDDETTQGEGDAATAPPNFPTEVPMGNGFRRTENDTDATSGVEDIATEQVQPLPGDADTKEPSVDAAATTPDTIRIVAQNATPASDEEIPHGTDGALLANDLQTALKLAAESGARRVEFAVTEVTTGPFEIPADDMEFVSSVGRTAVRLVTPDLPSIRRTKMVDVGNRRVSFRGLDFQWQLTDESVDGASMFILNKNRSVRFLECTLTLENYGTDDRVAFFHILTADKTEENTRTSNPTESSLPLVAIELDHTVARGAASLIEMDCAAALQFVWRNGLLAVSGRMIETAGAPFRPSLGTSPMRLSLSNVTAEIPKGLLRMGLNAAAPFAVPIERSATRCVFAVDDAQPHVEILGAESLDPPRPFLLLTGEENAYDVAPTLSSAMLVVSDLEQNIETITMADLLSEPPTWWLEKLPQWTVYWNNPVRAQPYHETLPSDYRQDGAGFGGFREAELPGFETPTD